MLKIVAPKGFCPEKKYIIDVIFKVFLNIKYELSFEKSDNYEIFVPMGKRVIISDSFFSKFTVSESYLDINNIPKSITQASKNIFIETADLPIIYGKDEFKIESNKVFCGIDIFASSFFMLSRWEEYVEKRKDVHGRFPCKLALSQRFNFQHLPVVNMYLEMLWNMLIFAGCKQIRSKRRFEIIATHDIDIYNQFNSFSSGFKHILGDIIKRKNLKMASDTTNKFIDKFIKKIKDAYDTFDLFMDISARNNLAGHFYFIAGKIGEKDVFYDISDTNVVKTMKNIINRGHIVGIHGSYDSFDDLQRLKNEVSRLNKLGIEVSEGRQHFLRFANPHTWQIWDKLNLKYDSSLGYTNSSGFRAGVCYEYPVFDLIERKQLKLIERPLIFMETTTVKKYNNTKDFVNIYNKLKQTTKKYNGQFVVLWHNSNVFDFFWQNFVDVNEILY